MLRNVKDLRGVALLATDGVIGGVKVSVGLTRQAVSASPLYESMAQLESTRDQGAPSGPAPEMRAGER